MNNTLVEMVNLFYAFQCENPNIEVSIEDFCKHYLANENIRKNEKYLPNYNQNFPIEGQLGRFLGRMAKFTDVELKIVAQSIDVDNIEEIWYLGAMYDLQNPTKSDIIHYCISEFSSGIAVINRLIAKEFIEEYPDLKDKRAKRLRITPKGTQKLISAFPELENMASHIFSPLSNDEKEIFFQIFSKLHKHHEDRYNKK
jgi:DNA-binding MarR family transcriptional regulator